MVKVVNRTALDLKVSLERVRADLLIVIEPRDSNRDRLITRARSELALDDYTQMAHLLDGFKHA